MHSSARVRTSAHTSQRQLHVGGSLQIALEQSGHSVPEFLVYSLVCWLKQVASTWLSGSLLGVVSKVSCIQPTFQRSPPTSSSGLAGCGPSSAEVPTPPTHAARENKPLQSPASVAQACARLLCFLPGHAQQQRAAAHPSHVHRRGDGTCVTGVWPVRLPPQPRVPQSLLVAVQMELVSCWSHQGLWEQAKELSQELKPWAGFASRRDPVETAPAAPGRARPGAALERASKQP